MEIPNLAGSTNHFVLMSAHLGTEIQMASGPFAQAPAKALQHMKAGEKIKGVTGKFFFLVSNCWQTVRTSVLNNQST